MNIQRRENFKEIWNSDLLWIMILQLTPIHAKTDES